MQAHSAGAGLPLWTGPVAAQPGKLLPILAAVPRFEKSRVLYSGVNMVRIAQRRLKMPDPFKLPGMLGAIVPHMGCERLPGCRNVIGKLVALALWHSVRSGRRFAGRQAGLEERFAAVVRPLNDLSEPAARLGNIDAVLIHR